ncbi:MAG: uroporphyrinogen-III synthase [Burkholderiaceae bacterium]|nr:uroporphyrinogen-III synthase [Burkholderiaceae bacterium]
MKPVIVTRPEREAQAWVDQLKAQGWLVQALPLICIEPPADPAALKAQQAQASGLDALMFVSPQAVQHFADPAWVAAGGRCWAPGPGTAQALRKLGVAPDRIDQPPPDASQFDSEALWAVVSGQVGPGCRVLVVRGQSADGQLGRDWLIRQCRAAGAEVATCIAYRRVAPVWDAAARARAVSSLHNGSIWLFSSSQALEHLAQLLPHASFGQARALVTHPKIEMSARRMGFGEIITTRPALSDVLTGLQAFT